MTRRLLSLVVLALVGAACSDSSEPTTTPVATTTTTTVAESTTTLADTTTTTAVEITTTTVPEVTGPLPSLLVAGPDGVSLLDADFMAQLTTEPAGIAFDDEAGNVYFQAPQDTFPFTPESTVIRVLETDSFEPRNLLVPTGEQYLELVDVADGMVWYTRREGSTPDDSRETLRAYDIATGEVVEIAQTGGWESGLIDASVGSGLIAAEWSGEALTGFDFYTLAGESATVPGDPYLGVEYCIDGGERGNLDTGESVGPGCYERPALSDDGRLAYIERNVDEELVRHFLVVVDLETGEELARWEPEIIGGSVWSLEIEGKWALLNRLRFVEELEYLPAVLVDLETGAQAEAALPGIASFEHGNVPISS